MIFPNIILLFSLLFIVSCYSLQEKISIEKNYIIFYSNTKEIQPLPIRKLIQQSHSISPEEWTSYGVYYFNENEYSSAEYCFKMAVKLSDFSLPPEPLVLNEPLKYILNLIFFYELSEFFYKEEQKELIQQYINLIQNRSDLMIATLWEIRKRNFSNLEIEFAEGYYQKNKNKLTQEFIYEYIMTLIHNKKIHLKNLELINNIKNESLKQYLIEQTANYFFNIDYKNYIELYNEVFKSYNNKIWDPTNIFYVENLFIAYYHLYKKNQISQIPPDIYKNLLKVKKVNVHTYQYFLDYYVNNLFLFSSYNDFLDLHIKSNCLNKFDLLCDINTKLMEYKIQKQILGTYNINKLNELKKSLIQFY